MSLRSLAIDIAIDTDTMELMSINSAVDEIKDSAIGAGDSIEDLGSATDEVSKSMLSRIESVGDSMGSVGKKMSVGLTAPIMAIGTAAIHTVSKFDDSMSKIRAISGATGDEFNELRQTAIELGSTTAWSASESADAMTMLATAGMSTNEILEATPNMLNLASAGGLELADAASITTSTLSQFSMEANEAGKVGDIFAMAAKSADTNVSELGEALKYAAGSATTMNMDLEQTNAVLATFAQQGLVGSSAGTTFTSMFNDLSKKAEDGSVAIGESTVALYDSSGAMRDMGSVMADIESSMDGLTEAQRNSALQSVFGSEAMKGVNIMLSEGSEAYKDLEEAMYSSDGVAADMAEDMEDSIAGAFRNMGSAIEGFMIVIGDELKPYVQAGAEMIADLAGWFGELGDGTRKFLAFSAAAVAAVGPVLFAASKVIGMFGPAIGIFTKATAVMKGAGGAITLLTNPIGIAVVAIGGLVAAGIWLWKNWDDVSEWLGNTWEWLVGVSSDVFGAIGDFITNVFTAVGDFIFDTWNTAVDWTSNLLNSLFENVMSIFNSVVDFIAGIPSQAWDIITSMVTGIIDLFIQYHPIGIVTSNWDEIIGFLKGIDLKQIGSDIIQGLIDGISNMASAVWDKVTEIGSGIADKFKSVLKIFSPSRLFEDFGMDTMLGYTIGFEDEADRTNDVVESAAYNVADSFMVPEFVGEETQEHNTSNNYTYYNESEPYNPYSYEVDRSRISNNQYTDNDNSMSHTISLNPSFHISVQENSDTQAIRKEMRRNFDEMLDRAFKKMAAREV